MPEIVLLVLGLSSISSVSAVVFPNCQIGFLSKPAHYFEWHQSGVWSWVSIADRD